MGRLVTAAADEGRPPSITYAVTAIEIVGALLVVVALGVLFGAAWGLLALGVAVFGTGVALDWEAYR